MNSRRIALSLCLLQFGFAAAGDLMDILPVTNSILEVQLREGHIDYFGVDPVSGEPYKWDWKRNVVYHDLLSYRILDRAEYHIGSSTDTSFKSGMPLHIGLKQRGTDIHSQYIKSDPPFLHDYRLYLLLPAPMKSGQTYTVAVHPSIKNRQYLTFTFNENELRSPTIKVSQIGYPQNAPKYAYLSMWMGDMNYGDIQAGALPLDSFAGAPFHVYDLNTNTIARSYTSGIVLQKSKTENDNTLGNWTRADVWEANFSDFTTPGRYCIVVEGIGRSFPFEIRNDIYRAPFYTAMRGMYYARQGIVKRLDEFDGRIYPRAKHPDDIPHFYDPTPHADQNFIGHKVKDFDYASNPIDGIWGHYHDAGDWDYYADSHWRLPQTMLLLYDMNSAAFSDGDIGNVYKLKESDAQWIDEGKSGIPDLLDEARWMIEFGKRSRHALMDSGYGSGGVPGYVGRDACNKTASWLDDRPILVKAESMSASFGYASAAAYFAHCLDKFAGGSHPESAEWLKEAKEAYAWAAARAGADTVWQRQTAAVTLYLVTGDTAYQNDYARVRNVDPRIGHGAWGGILDVQVAEAIYLVTCGDKPNLHDSLYGAVKTRMLRRALDVTNNHKLDDRGYRVGGIESGQGINVGMFSIPHTIFLAVAHKLTGEERWLDYMHTTMAYFLGGNQRNTVTITGLGHQSEKAVFHPDSWYLLDFNSKVYVNPFLPGYSAPNSPAYDVGGDYGETWARTSLLPTTHNWPQGEIRVDSRWSIAGSEFTIGHCNLWWIFATGYMLNKGETFTPQSRPTLKLDMAGSDLSIAAPVELKVTASAHTERVQYYYGWRYIGESRNKDAGFALRWDMAESGLASGDSVEITAVATDKWGQLSMPSKDAERQFIISGQTVSALASNIATTPMRRHTVRINPVTRTIQLPHSPGTLTAYTLQGRLVWTMEVTPKLAGNMHPISREWAKAILQLRFMPEDAGKKIVR
jgi:endoglucanase